MSKNILSISTDRLSSVVISALEDLKGKDIISIDTSGKTDMFECLIICTGTSDRHVKSLANHVIEKVKQAKFPVLSQEYSPAWALVDLYDVVVHVMLSETRKFYSLEKLWGMRRATEGSKRHV